MHPFRKEKPFENLRWAGDLHPIAGGVSNRRNFQKKLPFIPLVLQTAHKMGSNDSSCWYPLCFGSNLLIWSITTPFCCWSSMVKLHIRILGPAPLQLQPGSKSSNGSHSGQGTWPLRSSAQSPPRAASAVCLSPEAEESWGIPGSHWFTPNFLRFPRFFPLKPILSHWDTCLDWTHNRLVIPGSKPTWLEILRQHPGSLRTWHHEGPSEQKCDPWRWT